MLTKSKWVNIKKKYYQFWPVVGYIITFNHKSYEWSIDNTFYIILNFFFDWKRLLVKFFFIQVLSVKDN